LRRKRPTNRHKLRVLQALAQLKRHRPDITRPELIKILGYADSTIRDWERSPRLQQVAQLPHLRGFKALRTVATAHVKFKAQYDELYCKFIYKRKYKGEEVDKRWFRNTIKEIMNIQQPAGCRDFKASSGWLSRYLKRFRISRQLQTEKKPISNKLRVPLLQAFHRELCLLQQSVGESKRDPCFGRFAPGAIWNVDQIPFSFVRSHRHSYNPKGQACWIKTQGQSSNDKRMATIVLTLRAGGEQIIKPFILFKGQGCLSQEMLDELDTFNIPYDFNAKAWANGQSCLEYLQYFSKQTKLQCSEIKEHLLLLDGLGSQCTHEFIELALDLNIIPMYFPANCTHLVQPVDHHIAAWIKYMMGEFYKLEETVMSDEWASYRKNGSLSSQYKRASMLDWVQRWWAELKTRKSFILDSFVSTGCLISLSGEHAIKFNDIPSYTFSYPYPTL
jgi:hypothetical protein